METTPSTPPRIVRRILAVAPHLAPAIGEGRASDRAGLAGDDACPPAVLELLVEDLVTVAWAAASNPNCPPQSLAGIVERLGAKQQESDHWTVQHTYRAALSNPGCPEEVLRRLFDAKPGIVVGNPSCPPDLLTRGTRSGDWEVRLAALPHPSLPAAALLDRLKDTQSSVAYGARIALISRDYEVLRRGLLIVNARARAWMVDRLRPEQIASLSTDDDPRLRRLAARGAHDHAVLADLAADVNGHVRRAASQRLMAVVAA